MQRLTFLFFLLFTVLFASAQNGTHSFKVTDFTRDNTFSAKSVWEVKSMKDGLSYTTVEAGNTQIVKYSYQTGKKIEILLDLKKIKDCPISSFTDYEFSSTETKILLTTNPKNIYRHSFTADYYIWNSITKEFSPLSSNGRQQLATFSPDGERVAFVRDNNIFIKSLRFNTESQATTDGEFNKIINGAPDWVYEEEFSFSKAFAWSPDSKTLAYYRFDESQVPQYSMNRFKGEKPAIEKNALYPDNYTYKYPKAGEKNSIVQIYIYDVIYKKSIKADIGSETDQYIPRIQWSNSPDILTVMRLNRLQNKLEYLFVNPATGASRVAFTEENKRYIDEENFNNLFFLNDNKQLIISSERDGYNHLYLYDMGGRMIKQITNGKFDVTAFYGYDPIRKIFYYQAAQESPMRREVYALSWDGQKRICLSTQKGTNSAEFSEGFKYFINSFSNVSTPPVITLHDSQGKLIRVLEDNSALKQRLSEYQFNPKEFFKFTTSQGIELNGWMIKPVNFDSNKKYPVVMTQYSGPNSQQVLDRWGLGWENYLSQNEYLVVCVDPRGTGARGEEFRKCTYMQLGKFESDDQIEAAHYLTTLPFVDAKNIAIWGWSYGGFMVNLCLEKGNGIFKAGIAVAPVTNGRFYDNIYTERYMRTPQENPDGYDQNSPLFHAGELKGRLLLVHGSADDNVHFQNTMEFAEKLVQANIQFDMHVYTNRNHGIYGGNTRTHLYELFNEFLNQNLKK
ncbi:MAG: S9 family peptidase [Bacteroidota bacterium]|nr:S9 family peptidase [Bacteroidota bacterium]